MQVEQIAKSNENNRKMMRGRERIDDPVVTESRGFVFRTGRALHNFEYSGMV